MNNFTGRICLQFGSTSMHRLTRFTVTMQFLARLRYYRVRPFVSVLTMDPRHLEYHRYYHILDIGSYSSAGLIGVPSMASPPSHKRPMCVRMVPINDVRSNDENCSYRCFHMWT